MPLTSQSRRMAFPQFRCVENLHLRSKCYHRRRERNQRACSQGTGGSFYSTRGRIMQRSSSPGQTSFRDQHCELQPWRFRMLPRLMQMRRVPQTHRILRICTSSPEWHPNEARALVTLSLAPLSRDFAAQSASRRGQVVRSRIRAREILA